MHHPHQPPKVQITFTATQFKSPICAHGYHTQRDRPSSRRTPIFSLIFRLHLNVSQPYFITPSSPHHLLHIHQLCPFFAMQPHFSHHVFHIWTQSQMVPGNRGKSNQRDQVCSWLIVYLSGMLHLYRVRISTEQQGKARKQINIGIFYHLTA